MDHLVKGVNQDFASLLNKAGIMLCLGSLMVIFFYFLSLKIISKQRPELSLLFEEKAKRKDSLDDSHAHLPSKKPMGTWESLLYVGKMPYLRHLAMTVIAYGMSINLLEVYWKSQIKEYYPNSVDCMAFIAKAQIYNSYLAFILILVTGPLLRRLGWLKTAMIAPVLFLLTGGLFFAIAIFKDLPWGFLLSFFGFAGLSSLGLAVWVGFFQNVLSKASKNTLYNVTKELAYIPLDEEARIKGKSAIDILGERVGKWGGAFLVMLFIFICGDLSKTALPTGLMLIAVCCVWIYSTWKLGRVIDKKR